jgi:hypothetical protein
MPLAFSYTWARAILLWGRHHTLTLAIGCIVPVHECQAHNQKGNVYVLVHSERGHAGPRFDRHGTQQGMYILTMLQLGQRGNIDTDNEPPGGMT